MQHYSETDIESYVLVNHSVVGEKKQFEEHLQICFSCNELYTEISEFYHNLGKTHSLLKGDVDDGYEQTLVVRPQYSSKKRLLSSPDKPSLPARFWQYAADRPIKSTVSFLSVFALFALALNFNSFFKDTNPSYYVLNDSTKSFSIYNKSGEKLKNFDYKMDRNYQYWERNGLKYSVIADLDNDKKNEIISILPITDGADSHIDRLKILDSKFNIKKVIVFGDEFKYNSKHYYSEYTPRAIHVENINGNRNKELFILLSDKHSPCVIKRLSPDGNIIGEYWHYGLLSNIIAEDINNDGQNEFILCGEEDVENNAIISVIDPFKIYGKTRSSYCDGFEFSRSEAELFYIRYVDSRNLREGTMYGPAFVQFGNTNNGYRIEWDTRIAINSIRLYFNFSKDFRSLNVYLTDQARQSYKKLFEEGSIEKIPDNKSIEELKNDMEYWNGKIWQKKWTMVKYFK